MNKSKYKVIPGLSISGKELRRRLENRSLEVPDGQGSYSTDPRVTETLKMSRPDLFRSHLHDVQDVKDLGRKIKDAKDRAEAQKRAMKEAELIAKAKADAIAEYEKSKGNG